MHIQVVEVYGQIIDQTRAYDCTVYCRCRYLLTLTHSFIVTLLKDGFILRFEESDTAALTLIVILKENAHTPEKRDIKSMMLSHWIESS